MTTPKRYEHYEILRQDDGSLWELGRGAMGVTYKAWDTRLHCDVALKVIQPAILGNEEVRARFQREARAAAKLRHPNIATAHHLGETGDGGSFYAMEFCDGPTLHEAVANSGTLKAAEALEVALQVAKAFIIAEQHRVVHRDIKPANLILTRSADEGLVVKVIDFGLARVHGPNSTGFASQSGFMGTAHFASPEQIEERPLDIRSDFYALGACIWFMLTGGAIFQGSLPQILAQAVSAQPPWQQLQGQPQPLLDLLKRLLAKDAADRPATALALRTEIAACLREVRKLADAAQEAPAEPSAPQAVEALPVTVPASQEVPAKDDGLQRYEAVVPVAATEAPAPRRPRLLAAGAVLLLACLPVFLLLHSETPSGGGGIVPPSEPGSSDVPPVMTLGDQGGPSKEPMPEPPAMVPEPMPTPSNPAHSPEPAAGAVLTPEEQVRQFVRNYPQIEDSHNLDAIMARYAEVVDYGDKQRSRSEVREDKQGYFTQWTTTRHTLRDDVVVTLQADRSYLASFSLDFRVSNALGEWKAGESHMEMRITESGGPLAIFGEKVSGVVFTGKGGGIDEFVDLTLRAEDSRKLDAIMVNYAEKVDYFNYGVITNDTIRGMKRDYFKDWPDEHHRLLKDSLKITYLPGDTAEVRFTTTFNTISGGRPVQRETTHILIIASRDGRPVITKEGNDKLH